MKKMVLWAALCMVAVAHAQTIAWVNDPGGVTIATDAAENIVTARWDYNMAGDIYVAKRNAQGALLWEVRYDNTDTNTHEVATWIDADAGGNVLVSGIVRSGLSSPVIANSILMKFAPDGRLLWRRVYDGVFDGSSTRKLVVDAASNVYVLGLGSSAFGLRTTVRKLAPDGNVVWTWTDPIGIGAPLNFKWTPDGALLISARAISGSFNGYAKITRDGQAVWTLPGVASLTTGDAAGDAGGNSYLINGNYAAGGGSLLRKVAPDGNQVWERPHAMAGMRVEVGPDGAAVVSGYPNAGSSGAAFVKFSADGQLMWANLDADGSALALLAHAQMKLDTSGNAYLAAGNMSQMAVTKVSANGASAWTMLVPYGYAQGLALGASQSVYVTGGSTARIDQTGTVAPPPSAPAPTPTPAPAPAPTPTPAPPPPPPPVVVAADLGLSLVDAPDPVKVGARLVFTATVVNRGPGRATSTAFTATLPAGVSLLGIAPSQGSCSGTTTIRCALGSLGSGARATVSVTVRPLNRGTLVTYASVKAAEPDPNGTNNTASVATVVRR